jgi:hypothetical protein
MGLFTGAFTLTRFVAQGPKPRMFDHEHLDRLREARLPSPAGGTLARWAGGSHILDFDFSEAKNIYPDHLVWDFWTETDKIPADRFKAYYETELNGLASLNPSGLPTAKQKEQAREAARDQLEQEAKDGRFRKQKCIPVIWDMLRNEVLFGSTSDAAIQRFKQLFSETFMAHLFQTAIAETLEGRDAATLATKINSECKGLDLTNFNTGGQKPIDCRWALIDGRPDFIGNEMLVWLWHKSRGEGTVTVRDGSEIAFMFSGGMRLEHPTEKDNDTINAESAVRKPQAFRALQSGYLPRRTALTIVRNNEQFQFKLNAETLAFGALTLPKPEETDARARTIARFNSIRDFLESFDLLFDHFVQLRTSRLWESEVADIRKWLNVGRAVMA